MAGQAVQYALEIDWQWRSEQTAEKTPAGDMALARTRVSGVHGWGSPRYLRAGRTGRVDVFGDFHVGTVLPESGRVFRLADQRPTRPSMLLNAWSAFIRCIRPPHFPP